MNIQKLFVLLAIIGSLIAIPEVHAQGWMAVIDLDLNHELYAYEKITNATFTYSGVTQTSSSSTSNLQLILHGNGAITGDMDLSINGVASEPYYTEEPDTEPIAARFSGNFAGYCTRVFFERDGESHLEQVYIWIEVYPRLEIDDVSNDCDILTFNTNTCSDSFYWEVSANIGGGYRVIEGKTGPSITLTRDELISLGFSDPFGRKYFRVTGRPGTTSELQPVDIYYPPPAGSVSIAPPKCHDGSDGLLTVNITSLHPSVINDFVLTLFPTAPTGQIKQIVVNDGFTGTFEGLTAGSYRVRIENNSKKETYGACRVDIEVEPLTNPAETAISSFQLSDFHGYAVSCNGAADGRIRVNPTGGTGVYTTYEWSPLVSTTDLAENLSEGNYQVRIKDSNGCWSQSRSQRLTSPQKLTASLISVGGKNGFDVSCSDKTDGVIETHASGGVPGYTFLWSNGTAEGNLSNIGPGTYHLTMTDMNGCTTAASTTLFAPDPIDFLISEISGINCSGASTGILDVQAIMNNIGDASYAWSVGATSKEITNLPAGSYTVSVSDSQGCVATKHHTLSEPPQWSVDVMALSDYNGTPISCTGGNNAQLEAVVRDSEQNVVPAQGYTWYKNGKELVTGPQLSIITGLSAGAYRAEITYRDFCKVEKSITLNEPEPVVVTIVNETDYNGVGISCYGRADGGLRAIAEGGTGSVYEYSWASGQGGPRLEALSAGKYVVTARDENGCEGKAEKVLEQPDSLEATISTLSDYGGSPLSCADANDGRLSGSATGGVPPFGYQWNSGQTTTDLADIPAGHYLLTVTDANGCTSEAEKIVVAPVPVRAAVAAVSDHHGYGVSCNGGSDGFVLSTASGGTGLYEFLWKGASHSQPLYENLRAGTYTVIVKDQNGCIDTTSTSLTEPEALELKALTVTHASCTHYADGALELAASGGAGDYLFSITEGNSITEGSWRPESLLSGLTAGTYRPVVMDINGCRTSITKIIEEPVSISIEFADIQPALCGDPRGMVSAVVSGGTGSYQYEWTNSEQHIISNAARISNLASGIFTLQVLDAHHCEATRAVGISSADGPAVKLGSIIPATCHDASDGRAELIVEGTHPFSFLWQDGQQTAAAVNLGKGEHLVEITDANQCKVIQSVVVTAPEPIEIELVEKKEPACSGDCNGKLVVSGKGGNGLYHFAWDNFIGAEANNLCKGQYKVTLTDQKGCASTTTFTLAEPEVLDLKLVSAKNPVCPNGCDGKIAVSASGGTGSLLLRWNTGADTEEISGLCAGTYAITVTDDRNCIIDKSFALADPPVEDLNLGGSLTLCTGQTHVLDPGSFWQKYLWGSNTGVASAEQRLVVSDPGLYWVAATSPMGCVVRDTFLLKTSADLLHANFLVASEALVTDTIVMIDISWPLPDAILWALPSGFERFHDLGDVIHGKFLNAGHYNISLEATLGKCRDNITKTITILSDDTLASKDMNGGGRSVEEFALYPNPNDGAFDVVASFVEKSKLTLTVWNTLTGEKLGHINDVGEDFYRLHIDLRPLSGGPYTLRLDYENETKYLRFIVR